MSLYLRPLVQSVSSARHPPIEASIHQIMKEVSLLYCIPRNKFQTYFATGRLSLQETIYAHCVWVFVAHFLNRLGKSGSMRCLRQMRIPLINRRLGVHVAGGSSRPGQQRPCRDSIQDQAKAPYRDIHRRLHPRNHRTIPRSRAIAISCLREHALCPNSRRARRLPSDTELPSSAGG